MKKEMSKNQLVSYIHALSGKSYKEARQICKAAKWKKSTALVMALHFDQCVGAFASAADTLARAFNEMGDAIAKALNNLAPTIQTLADSMRQSDENMIQNDT